MGSILDSGAADRSKKQAAIQRKEIAAQRQKSEARIADEKSEIERRKAVAAKGGARGSLLATSETGTAGLAKKLGG